MKRWLLLVALTLACTGSRADMTAVEWIAHSSVIADVVSTRYAVNQGAEEANPLYGSYPSNTELAISAALRFAAIRAIGNVDHPTAQNVLRIMSMVNFGIAGNNYAAGADQNKGGYFVLGMTIPLHAEIIAWAVRR